MTSTNALGLLFYLGNRAHFNVTDAGEGNVSAERARISAIDVLSEENGRSHHTGQYDMVQGGGLVIRRGQPFNLILHFDKKFNFKKNTIRLVFKAGMFYRVKYNTSNCKNHKYPCLKINEHSIPYKQ